MVVVDRIIINVQNGLAAQGVRGATHLASQFRLMDADGSGKLTLEEFSRGIAGAGLRLSSAARLRGVPAARSGGRARPPRAAERRRRFVHALAGGLSPRAPAVGQVFRRIVGEGGGDAASLGDVGACYRADRHPDVERGAKTAAAVLSEFMGALRESAACRTAAWTLEGLLDFYRLSAAFVGDNEFEATMEAVWRPRGAAVSSRKRARGRSATARRRSDISALFAYFDADRSGEVDYDEFLAAIRGPPNARRQAMVAEAFSVLDADGSGVVEPSDIVSRFDASKHPDVKKGARTPDEVMREFLDTFDVGGVVAAR
ncbi:protein serine/threonine kinase [Aureococcus anophagefferens]|uniref:Protein serine/threonine kinase n=1 Tax=Aureococcus anophagefferens TaxID=44056 RepID=A0ABR1G8V0_AURAN